MQKFTINKIKWIIAKVKKKYMKKIHQRLHNCGNIQDINPLSEKLQQFQILQIAKCYENFSQ